MYDILQLSVSGAYDPATSTVFVPGAVTQTDSFGKISRLSLDYGVCKRVFTFDRHGQGRDSEPPSGFYQCSEHSFEQAVGHWRTAVRSKSILEHYLCRHTKHRVL